MKSCNLKTDWLSSTFYWFQNCYFNEKKKKKEQKNSSLLSTADTKVIASWWFFLRTISLSVGQKISY